MSNTLFEDTVFIKKKHTTDNVDAVKRLYGKVALIRKTEKRIAEIYPTDKIKSPVHLSIGQEAISVGVCDALEHHDVVSGTYRSHAMYLAKGGDLKAMMAELYGKSTGCSSGRGGSMHLISPEENILGTSAIVGTTIPLGVGYSMALKKQKKPGIVAIFMGDGATEEGAFYESINFAALHKLPVLFVCENNSYAIYTHLKKRWSSPKICDRVAGFGIPTHRIENGDIFAIRNHVAEVKQLIEKGNGPYFLECLTYRWTEHVGPNEDFNLGYRTRDEMTVWENNDQFEYLRHLLSPDLRKQIDQEIDQKIESALQFAEESPFPDCKELFDNVYAN
ncbi:MAG: acetoin dehydrogenase [Legionella sp.]|nr:MAG: acetoin dehydrogenase [Legionella sp.]